MLTTALITGASSGMGRAIAQSLSKRSNLQLALLARNVDRLKETQNCLQNPKNSKIFECDLANENSLKNTMQDVCENYGPLQIIFFIFVELNHTLRCVKK